MKRILFALLTASSISSYALVGDANASSAQTNITNKYKAFLTELDYIGQLSYAPQIKSVAFSNDNYKPLNSNFDNINKISANIVPSEGHIIQALYSVSFIMKNNPIMPTEIIFARHVEQPAIGGAIYEQDITSNKISKGLDLIRSLNPTAKYLTEILIEKEVRYGKVDYFYLFSKNEGLNKKSMCDGYSYDPQKHSFQKSDIAFRCF